MASTIGKRLTRDTERYEILIAGMGGEGVVSIGEILGLAATLDGKFASQRNTYGASQRGEAICSEIIISEKTVQFPFIESPTHFISLSQQGFDGYCYRIREFKNTALFIDYSHKYDLLGFNKKFDIKKFESRGIAIKNNLPLMGNIILLTNFIKGTKIISQSVYKQALLRKATATSKPDYVKAFTLGWNLKQI